MFKRFLIWLQGDPVKKVMHAQERDSLELAKLLHRSNAWHCGCSKCRVHSDWLPFGETVHLSDEERMKLCGNSITLYVK